MALAKSNPNTPKGTPQPGRGPLPSAPRPDEAIVQFREAVGFTPGFCGSPHQPGQGPHRAGPGWTRPCRCCNPGRSQGEGTRGRNSTWPTSSARPAASERGRRHPEAGPRGPVPTGPPSTTTLGWSWSASKTTCRGHQELPAGHPHQARLRRSAAQQPGHRGAFRRGKSAAPPALSPRQRGVGRQRDVNSEYQPASGKHLAEQSQTATKRFSRFRCI